MTKVKVGEKYRTIGGDVVKITRVVDGVIFGVFVTTIEDEDEDYWTESGRYDEEYTGKGALTLDLALDAGPIEEANEPRLKSLQPCPKCGHSSGADAAPRNSVQYDGQSNTLWIACIRCGYGWVHPPLDAAD